jgi:signal transduction histidine kinase
LVINKKNVPLQGINLLFLMGKRKKYIPLSRFNPIVMEKKVGKLMQDIEMHKHMMDSVIKSNEQHVIFLSNFARHDMKNAIQSMDSILSTTPAKQFTDNEIKSLKTSLTILRQTIDNFAQLVPHSQNGEFSLRSLLSSIESLSRNDLVKNQIDATYDYQRDSSVLIKQPFQSLLQVLHNIVINAEKAMQKTEIKKMYISATLDNEFCEIRVADTGELIPLEDREKIFTYGYSTTGGTGIGLFHAKYMCDIIKGSIKVSTECDKPLTKIFILQFPTKNTNNDEKEHINN